MALVCRYSRASEARSKALSYSAVFMYDRASDVSDPPRASPSA